MDSNEPDSITEEVARLRSVIVQEIHQRHTLYSTARWCMIGASGLLLILSSLALSVPIPAFILYFLLGTWIASLLFFVLARSRHTSHKTLQALNTLARLEDERTIGLLLEARPFLGIHDKELYLIDDVFRRLLPRLTSPEQLTSSQRELLYRMLFFPVPHEVLMAVVRAIGRVGDGVAINYLKKFCFQEDRSASFTVPIGIGILQVKWFGPPSPQLGAAAEESMRLILNPPPIAQSLGSSQLLRAANVPVSSEDLLRPSMEAAETRSGELLWPSSEDQT